MGVKEWELSTKSPMASECYLRAGLHFLRAQTRHLNSHVFLLHFFSSIFSAAAGVFQYKRVRVFFETRLNLHFFSSTFFSGRQNRLRGQGQGWGPFFLLSLI